MSAVYRIGGIFLNEKATGTSLSLFFLGGMVSASSEVTDLCVWHKST